MPYRTVKPFIRMFCPIDASPLSALALSYVDAMVLLGFPVRLIAVRVAQLAAVADGPWARHRGLFLTPIATPFVNVVCGEPFDWHRLYTVNVKNVLIASSPPSLDDRVSVVGARKSGVVETDPVIAAQVAARYDVIVVPDLEISYAWAKLDIMANVVPTETGPNAALLASALALSHVESSQPSS